MSGCMQEMRERWAHVAVLPKTQLYIEFATHEDTRFCLSYELFDTPLTHHWLKLLRKDIAAQLSVYNGGVFYSGTHDELSELTRLLNTSLQELESLKPGCFAHYCREEFDRKTLSLLHDSKEKWMLLEGEDSDTPFAVQLQDLNILIHRYDAACSDAKPCDVVVVPYPPTREKLTKEDLMHFHLDYLFGHLYLDYATNGVPVVDSFYHPHPENPVPQSEITSGFKLSFTRDDYFSDLHWNELQEWLICKRWDPEDPRLALGNGLLGRLRVRFQTPQDIIGQIQRARRVASVQIVDMA